MLKKVDKDDMNSVSSDSVQLNLTLSSISEGNTEGYLWTDEDQETYFLWDMGNIVFYIFGGGPSSRYLEDLSDLFDNEIQKEAQEKGFSHFKINDMTDISDRSIKSIFGDKEYKILKTYFYEYNEESVEEFSSSFDKLEVVDIDEEFLKSTELKNLARVINEVKWMWPSFERYYKSGFGKAGLIDDEIVCWCTAEYVSENTCGIGIETLDRYRQMGIATKTAAEFIDYCLKNYITTYWGCGAYNEPSVKLAEKLGFKKIDEYKVLLAKF